jgi:hypothetical protein
MGWLKKAASTVAKVGSFGIGGNNFAGSGRNIFGGKEAIFNDDGSILSFGGEKTKKDGTPYTKQDLTIANLFSTLSPEQQKDLLLNNPTIETPEGGQSYDPYTNTITLKESDFTKSERLRQEGLAAQLSGSLNGDFSNNGQAIQDATFARGKAQIDPIVKQQRRELAQQLADQGMPAGSEGYNEAMNRLDDSIARQYTDLSQASIQTSEQVRGQRFNEIASLLGRSQVGAGSSFAQNQGSNFNGLDLFGAEQSSINRAFQNEQNRLQLRQQNKNAIYSALGGLGAAGVQAAPGIIAAASDRDLKENIKQISISPSGIPIYEFDYKDKKNGVGTYEGVMAQDLLESNPSAIIKGRDGYLSVDYSQIDVEFRRIK